MKTTTIILLLQASALAHVGLAAAGLTMPRIVNLPAHVAGLPEFIRRLFWVYYSFIALFVVSFGGLTFLFAAELAGGSPLARGVCIFLAVFWTIRLLVAAFVFDVKPYLKTKALRVGYHATNFVFVMLPVVYLLAACLGGRQ